MEQPVILKIKDISKRYKKKKVLSNINLEIYQGEIFGIIGMSGVGKSTFLQTIIGILHPDSGDVLFRPEHLLRVSKESILYKSVYYQRKAVKNLFGFATQTPSFYPDLTVEENLKYFGSLYNLSKDILHSNIETALTLVALNDEGKIIAKNLSGGMKKRLDIACAIVHDPDILILDEPTADLDPILREQMWDLIRKINSTGTTIIVASHFLEEIENFCDRVGILYDANMKNYGTINTMIKKYFDFDEIHLETVPGMYNNLMKAINNKKLNIEKIENMGHKIVIYCKKAEAVLKPVLTVAESLKENILGVTINKPKLKNVFEKITNRKIADL